MARYINKDALIAEIKKYKNNAEAYLKYHHNRNDKLVHSFEQEKLVMSELLSFLDTLEIKEVSLDNALSSLDEDIKEFITTKEFENESALSGRYWAIAKHAFLLGLRAQKGE